MRPRSRWSSTLSYRYPGGGSSSAVSCWRADDPVQARPWRCRRPVGRTPWGACSEPRPSTSPPDWPTPAPAIDRSTCCSTLSPRKTCPRDQPSSRSRRAGRRLGGRRIAWRTWGRDSVAAQADTTVKRPKDRSAGFARTTICTSFPSSVSQCASRYGEKPASWPGDQCRDLRLIGPRDARSRCLCQAPLADHDSDLPRELSLRKAIRGVRQAEVGEHVAAARHDGDVVFTAEAVPDIRVRLWEKFLFICAYSGVTSLTRLPIGVILADPTTRQLYRGVMEEVAAVGCAEVPVLVRAGAADADAGGRLHQPQPADGPGAGRGPPRRAGHAGLAGRLRGQPDRHRPRQLAGPPAGGACPDRGRSRAAAALTAGRPPQPERVSWAGARAAGGEALRRAPGATARRPAAREGALGR